MITLDTIDSSLHSIQIKDAAGDALAIGADGSINITDNGGSLTVDGTVELGATTLAALENIVVSGTVELGATTLAALESITVVATDLDIRNLVFATDKVDVSGSTIATTEAGYSSWKVTAQSIDTTAGGTELVSTPLTGRIRVEIQNLGSNDIYIKDATGVTTANGLKIPKGSSYEQALDDGANIFAIAAAGTADIRTAEYAA